jgi:hypothetical protein
MASELSRPFEGAPFDGAFDPATRGSLHPSCSLTGRLGEPASCGGEFICPKCLRLVGWCFGCADDQPAVCDDCWSSSKASSP